MDVKDILRLATNPLITGALGAYLAKEKLGNKYGNVVSMAGGALAGAIAGALVQQFLLPSAPAAAPAQQGLPFGLGAPANPNAVNLDFSALPVGPQPVAALPPAMGVPGPETFPGSEGAFARTSYDTADGLAADEAMAEVKRNGWGN